LVRYKSLDNRIFIAFEQGQENLLLMLESD
jgi:hypothetical protein